MSGAELAAAARRFGAHQPDPQLSALARAAVYAVTFGGADPELTLSFVIWPTEAVLEAEARVGDATSTPKRTRDARNGIPVTMRPKVSQPL